jgi:putative addiction module component (TIGR02574 family)
MLTVEQIVSETRQWPSEKIEELMFRLNDLDVGGVDVKIAWKAEIEKRVAEIQTGRVQGIPLEESLTRIRKIAGL